MNIRRAVQRRELLAKRLSGIEKAIVAAEREISEAISRRGTKGVIYVPTRSGSGYSYTDEGGLVIHAVEKEADETETAEDNDDAVADAVATHDEALDSGQPDAGVPVLDDMPEPTRPVPALGRPKRPVS